MASAWGTGPRPHQRQAAGSHKRAEAYPQAKSVYSVQVSEGWHSGPAVPLRVVVAQPDTVQLYSSSPPPTGDFTNHT